MDKALETAYISWLHRGEARPEALPRRSSLYPRENGGHRPGLPSRNPTYIIRTRLSNIRYSLVPPQWFKRGVGIVLHLLFSAPSRGRPLAYREARVCLDPASSDDPSAPIIARLTKGAIPFVLSLFVFQFPLSSLRSHFKLGGRLLLPS